MISRRTEFHRPNGWTAMALAACTIALALGTPVCSADPPAETGTHGRTFDSPKQAVEALIAAAARDDVSEIEAIFGPDGHDIVDTGEPARNKKNLADFVARVREQQRISTDPKNPDHAMLVIGKDHWPFPVPLAREGGKWFFDSKAGLQEILYRRIGGNELDAIAICHGYVEAQNEYAAKKRDDAPVTQYAQRIISTEGKQDGLAWKNADGTWGGPIGENVAHALEEGYAKGSPYHGYFFKILKGQGPAAPLGQLDYVVKGAMIGGFALVATPAEYRVTGVKTFIVSNDGVVYEKDLGADTAAQFKAMELFDPDESWTPVEEERASPPRHAAATRKKTS
ncbi:MAG TPA: DUF2950 domain-containing protein [Candidatus Binatia bacterium]